MKALAMQYPYEQLTGLNPFEQELKQDTQTLTFMVEQLGRAARLNAYFAGFAGVTSDDVRSMSHSSGSLTFNLDVKDSRFCHQLAQFTGLRFEKQRCWDGQSIDLIARVPEGHALHECGIDRLTVAGYLPESCKVVVKDHTPLSDSEREVYAKLIAEGRPVYETVCSEPTDADVLEQPLEAEYAEAL